MDQDLIAYLDQQFSTIDRRFSQIDQRFFFVDQRLSALDKRLSDMDRRFISVDKRFMDMDKRFVETGEQIKSLRAETAQQFQEVQAQIHQQLQVVQTETARQFQEVQEHFNEVDRRFEGVETDIRRSYVVLEEIRDQVRLVAADGVANVNERLTRHQEEAARKLSDAEALNRLSYTDLDTRVRKLEGNR